MAKKHAARPAKTATAAARPRAEAPAANGDLAAVRTAVADETGKLFSVIAQAGEAQKSLAVLHKRLQALEARHEAELGARIGAVEGERDEARVEAARLDGVRQALEKDAAAALKALRALAGGMAALPDPLTPAGDGDDDHDLAAQRDRLAALVGDKATPANLAESLLACRDLVAVVAARGKAQANRLRLAGRRIEELEQSGKDAAEEGQALRAALAEAQKQFDETLARLKTTAKELSATQDELDQARKSAEAQAKAAAATEAKLRGQAAKLDDELGAARTRVAELTAKLSEACERARRGERTAVDLAESLVGLVDADRDTDELVEAPSPTIARDELEALANEAGEGLDGEMDEILQEDLSGDLLSSAKSLAEVLAKRRDTLAAALRDERGCTEALRGASAAQAGEITDLREQLAEATTDLNRTRAQLEAAQSDVERLSGDLAARQKELTEVRGDLARATSQLDNLRDKADLAKRLQGELDTTRTTLAEVRKQGDRTTQQVKGWQGAQVGLAKALVELATATDSALAVCGQKGGVGAHVGRFTKTFQRLEEVRDGADLDLMALIKSSSDVVEKVTNRLGHITQELQRRGEVLADRARTATDLEKRLEREGAKAAEEGEALKKLRDENTELTRAAKRLVKVEEQLAAVARDLDVAKVEGKELKTALKQARAELEEVRAREAEAGSGMAAEISELKKRLADEAKARRQTEAAGSDLREELTSERTVLSTKLAELEKILEERDRAIATLRDQLSTVSGESERAAELQARADGLATQLAEAQERARAMEGRLAGAEDATALAAELASAHQERDALQMEMRATQKLLADLKGENASLRAQAETARRKHEEAVARVLADKEALQEKYDEAAEENRRMKERNAGLNARIRTLTEA